MTIRTITQLPREEHPARFLSGHMEMSIPLESTSNAFCSKQIYYSDIRNDIHTYAINDIVNSYGLNGTSGPLKLSSLYNTVNKISAQDVAFNGKKLFNEWPYVSADFPTNFYDDANVYGDSGEYILPNVKTVRKMINDNSIFMSTTSSVVAEGNPLPHHSSQDTAPGVPESLDYENTIGSGKFYFWQLDNGLTDSSESNHDINSGSRDAYEMIRDTGNLVVWGWLADNPDNPPNPAQCWVAMYARMKCEGFNDTQVWVPISVQPWIRGVNASTLQYVSFNLPVKAGLELKIVTGFPVNGNNSGFQEAGSLTFLQSGWISNAFYGYVIK